MELTHLRKDLMCYSLNLKVLIPIVRKTPTIYRLKSATKILGVMKMKDA